MVGRTNAVAGDGGGYIKGTAVHTYADGMTITGLPSAPKLIIIYYIQNVNVGTFGIVCGETDDNGDYQTGWALDFTKD